MTVCFNDVPFSLVAALIGSADVVVGGPRVQSRMR